MTQGLPRTRFNSAGLVRALAELAVADAAEPRQSFAERLGVWLDFKEALALYAALNSAAVPAGRADTARQSAAAMRTELARVRSDLAQAIAAADAAQKGGESLPADAPAGPPSLPDALAQAATDSVADPATPDFAPLHRHYMTQQRRLAAVVGPLRAQMRAELGRQSAALKQLAALDAVMEQALAAREAGLLAQVPVLLGGRFARLFEAHGGAADGDAAGWLQPGGWLARFCAEMQQVLLAELDLRLMPVAGLVAALDTESTERE
ncbi:DUF3348 family protein [Thauera sp. SDU_THAU2]|uniref:DUF3348 family protein n=1 Tax=Thauera sp. SDU_THAU2 TaxID=3136633 RepID=UPI00311FA222